MINGFQFFVFVTNKMCEKCGVHLYSAPRSQYFVEPPFFAITAASLFGKVSTSFSHLESDIFAHSKIAQALSVWMESVCEQQFPSLATDSQLDLGLDFDWAILTHEYALI